MFRSLILFLLLAAGFFDACGRSVMAYPFEDRYTRPISDVITDIEKNFDVEIRVEVDTAGVTLRFADARIRPYSIEETLNNVLKPLDFRWERKGKNRFVVRYFDYPRRTFEEGAKMIEYLSSLYGQRTEWEARRDSLVSEVRQRLGVDTLMAKFVPGTMPEYSSEREYDGYRVVNYHIETLPGIYLCGSVYLPDSEGKHPLIICPNGHFKDGRYNDEQQLRKATLARMGAICVDYDLIGWGESALQLGEEVHNTDFANSMQIANGLLLLQTMSQLPDVDTALIGLNGGSGGGTQVLYLAALDPRVAAACPVVNIGAHFDGGCPCESGCAAMLSAGGSCHPELAACFAPKPMMVVSDGGDWTAAVPEVEYPYLRRIYSFFGAEDKISNVHLPDERHDFGPNKRKAVYHFFVDTFGLDPSRIDETAVTIEDSSQMMSLPASAIRFQQK